MTKPRQHGEAVADAYPEPVGLPTSGHTLALRGASVHVQLGTRCGESPAGIPCSRLDWGQGTLGGPTRP